MNAGWRGRTPRAAAILAIGLLSALLSRPARADPRFVWETLDTPHFEIHYHQGELQLALRVARLAEEAHARLSPILDHEPAERCQLVVQDDTDFANGNATPLFYNLIHAFAPPPDPRGTLSDFDDPVWELVSHEYTHILHLDTVRGVAYLTNQIFGKLWIPNGVQPTWLIEGMAVLSESRVTAGGRVRSALEDMSARAMSLGGVFPDIDELSNPTLKYPRGNIPYTIGGRLLDFVEDHYGAGAIHDLSYDYAGRLVPLAMNLNATHALGKSWIDLYAEYRRDEDERALEIQAAVQASASAARGLDPAGETARPASAGRLPSLLFEQWAGPIAELRALKLAPCCALGHEPAGQRYPTISAWWRTMAIATSPSRPMGQSSIRAPRSSRSSRPSRIYIVDDPASGARGRVTRGLRASEPDIAPDGALVFIQRLPAGRTAVSILEPGAREPRVLFEDPEHAVLASPRRSPSGNAVVFLHHRASWNLSLIGRDGSGFEMLTDSRALDRDPVFSPDGRYIFYSSDRTGIYNVYALRLADKRLFRVTNVVFGAFEPALSPDMSQLALVTYSYRGYDLARMPFDESKLVPVEAPPLSEFNRPPPTPAPPDELYPSRPYNPIPTLLPKWWLPYAASDAGGSTLGLITSGQDAVDRHDYAATLWWSLGGHMPGWDIRYTNHTNYPDISFTTTRDLVVPPGFTDNLERDVQAGVFAAFPFDEYERSWAFGLGYDLIHLAYDAGPDAHPPDGFVSRLTFQLAYSDAFEFAHSVSPEQGQNFVVNFYLADPAIGSDFAYRQLVGAYTRYLALPFRWNDVPLHHALRCASPAASRAAISPSATSSPWRLRADQYRRYLDQSPERAGVDPPAASSRAVLGRVLCAGHLEYRFPIVNSGARRLDPARLSAPDPRGPLQRRGRRLHPAPARLQAAGGAGAELRAELVLGWYLPTNLRAGSADGVTRSIYSTWDCYAAIGGLF